MSDKFINSSGLTYLWNKLTHTLASHGKSGDDVAAADKTAAIPFGIVDSTSTSTKYTATVDGITELVDGTCVLLKNSVVTSAANFTININNLGAKPSYNNMATGNPTTPTAPTRDTTIFNVNYTMLFIYSSTLVSGGAWICYRGYDANTNTLGYQLRTNSYVLNASDGFRYYVILFTSADGTKWVPANSNKSNSATTAKTVNQTPINPFGEIVYCGNTTNYSAGSAVTATAIWQEYTVTLGYSFNRTGAALTLTTKKPVYVKCAPQTDGSAIIDSTTPYVQDLPTTDDGKIYILLGMAYSATSIELLMNHPVYYHKDGAIRVWTNAYTPTLPTIDNTPTEDSDNLVTSGGVKAAIDDLADDTNENIEILSQAALELDKRVDVVAQAVDEVRGRERDTHEMASGVEVLGQASQQLDEESQTLGMAVVDLNSRVEDLEEGGGSGGGDAKFIDVMISSGRVLVRHSPLGEGECLAVLKKVGRTDINGNRKNKFAWAKRVVFEPTNASQNVGEWYCPVATKQYYKGSFIDLSQASTDDGGNIFDWEGASLCVPTLVAATVNEARSTMMYELLNVNFDQFFRGGEFYPNVKGGDANGDDNRVIKFGGYHKRKIKYCCHASWQLAMAIVKAGGTNPYNQHKVVAMTKFKYILSEVDNQVNNQQGLVQSLQI